MQELADDIQLNLDLKHLDIRYVFNASVHIMLSLVLIA